LFVLEQLNCLRSAKANLLPGAWQRESGDPQQQLRDLLHECGVQPRKLTEVIGKLIGIAKGRPSISKLTRTAVFAALEGGDPLRSSQALGAARWEDVRILLDASVAIPLLCALRTEPVETYLFALSSRAVDLLHGLGAQLKLSPGHLEECAAHLLRATLYEPIESDPDFSAALKQSENAYVAFYYALRAERRGAPDSLQRFLSVFVRNIVQISQNYGNNTTAVRMVMPDLQGAFSEYSVIVEQSERIPQLRYEAIGKVHDLILAEEGREKSPRLRSHDISALAHLEASFLTKHESWMLLTWDRVVIRVGGSELQGSWVVSPEIAMDFAQPCRRITETQWCSLAHRIARISDPGETLTARILDEIVRLRHELLQDWQFKDELRRFRDEAVQRAPVGEDNRLQAWVEQEASAFIASRQIEPSGEIQTEIEGISTPETEEPIE
jgi:hypothetical protein